MSNQNTDTRSIRSKISRLSHFLSFDRKSTSSTSINSNVSNSSIRSSSSTWMLFQAKLDRQIQSLEIKLQQAKQDNDADAIEFYQQQLNELGFSSSGSSRSEDSDSNNSKSVLSESKRNETDKHDEIHDPRYDTINNNLQNDSLNESVNDLGDLNDSNNLDEEPDIILTFSPISESTEDSYKPNIKIKDGTDSLRVNGRPIRIGIKNWSRSSSSSSVNDKDAYPA